MCEWCKEKAEKAIRQGTGLVTQEAATKGNPLPDWELSKEENAWWEKQLPCDSRQVSINSSQQRVIVRAKEEI